MKLVTILMATLISTAAFADSADLYACLQQNDSVIGMEDCQFNEFKLQNENLKAETQKLMHQLALKPELKKKYDEFKISSRSFDFIRDTACTLEVLDMEGGTGQGNEKAKCLTRLTQERILEVQNQLQVRR